MRTFAFFAVAVMSLCIVADVNAQTTDDQVPKTRGKNQVDGDQSKRGRRGRRNGEQNKGLRKRQQRGAQWLDNLIGRFDTDKDGSISLEEAPDRMKNRFAKIDTNDDKSVSKEELQASFAKMRGARGEQGQGRKGGKGKGKGNKPNKDGTGKARNQEGQRGRRSMLDPAKLMERADTNKDGVLSLDETPDRMKKMFDRIDADSSGTVGADELKAAFEKMKQRGGGKAIGRNKSANPENKLPKKPKRPPTIEEAAK